MMMFTCPRCGAANGAGRNACWNCWEPIDRSVQDPHQDRTAVDATVATTAPPRVLVGEPRPPAPPQPPAPASRVEEAPAPSRGFTFVSHDPRRSRVRYGEGWIALIMFALLAIGLAGGYSTLASRPTPRMRTPFESTNAYLNALIAADTGTQQWMATDSSKGVSWPAWVTITYGEASGDARVDRDTARVPARVTLAPTVAADEMAPAAVTALSQSYTIEVVLKRRGGEWRVSQHETLASVRTEIIKGHPGIALPDGP